MTTQKTFKRGVRARMAKTGESYATARKQLIHKADARSDGTDATSTVEPTGSTAAADAELPVSDEAVRRGTGRGWEEWFALLDAWGAAERRRPELPRWLVSEHGVGPWWAQSVTGGYERARGLRAKHQMADGYSVAASRTVAVAAENLLRAFTDPRTRRRWLPDTGLRRRPTRAANTVRYDWPEPSSVVAVYVTPVGERKSRLTIQHERLPDAETAERFKRFWRERLSALKPLLEA